MDRTHPLPDPVRQLAAGRTTLTRLLGRALLREPLRGLAWIGGGAAAFAVCGNILLMQPERHRAPMFVGNPQIHAAPVAADVPLPPQRQAFAPAEAETVRKAELLAEIQSELTRRGALTGEGNGVPGPRTVKAIREAQAQHGLPVTGEGSETLLAALLTAPAPRPRDPIASLLRSPSDRLERPATVAAAQRALNRLGYGPLKDDGQFGASTRAALDRFERDRRLPPRGDSPARVLKELALASGMAID